MRVVRTPVKNIPSNARSRATRARSQVSQSRPEGSTIFIRAIIRDGSDDGVAVTALDRGIASDPGQHNAGGEFKTRSSEFAEGTTTVQAIRFEKTGGPAATAHSD